MMSYPLVGGGEGMRMEQIGIIREIRDGLAVVEVHRQSACSRLLEKRLLHGEWGMAVPLCCWRLRTGRSACRRSGQCRFPHAMRSWLCRCCLCSTLSALSDSLLYHSVPMADRMALGRLHCSGCCCLPDVSAPVFGKKGKEAALCNMANKNRRKS